MADNYVLPTSEARLTFSPLEKVALMLMLMIMLDKLPKSYFLPAGKINVDMSLSRKLILMFPC